MRQKCASVVFGGEGLKPSLPLIRLSLRVVGRRHFWLFSLVRAAECILYSRLIYHVYSLCMYTAMGIFSGLPTMTKGRLPTNMVAGTMQLPALRKSSYHTSVSHPCLEITCGRRVGSYSQLAGARTQSCNQVG